MIQTPSSTSISLRAFLDLLRESAEGVIDFGDYLRNRENVLQELEAAVERGERHGLDTVCVHWKPVFSLPEEGRWPP